jgi:acetyl-CoA acetyltransferase
VAEVYDLSTALELDWYENLGLCKAGEAVPAQAIAQVCEITWQLQGRAGARQVEGARAGITANQGLFGHGSSVLLSL